MNFELLHPADQLVMLMERIYQYGMTTTSGGNLSILDENGDIWITPGSVDKGSLSRKDIIQVKPDGTVIGIHKPSSEFPVHERIYRARPDIRAILHAHPPALVAFSIVRKIPETRLIPNFVEICGNVSIAPYDVPGSTGLSIKVTNEFQKGNNVVMLENHGVLWEHPICSRPSCRLKRWITVPGCRLKLLKLEAFGRSVIAIFKFQKKSSM